LTHFVLFPYIDINIYQKATDQAFYLFGTNLALLNNHEKAKPVVKQGRKATSLIKIR
jgi:hypothetical protein